jgi:hypothetical protein
VKIACGFKETFVKVAPKVWYRDLYRHSGAQFECGRHDIGFYTVPLELGLNAEGMP